MPTEDFTPGSPPVVEEMPPQNDAPASEASAGGHMAAGSASDLGEVVGIQIGELETATGEEDLDPLLDALSPVLDAVG